MKKSKIKKIRRERMNYKEKVEKLNIAFGNAIEYKKSRDKLSAIDFVSGKRFFIISEEQLNILGIKIK